MNLRVLQSSVILSLVAAGAVGAQGPPAQGDQTSHSNLDGNPRGDIPTEIMAVRVQGNPPVIDGKLDDQAWTPAPAITRFLQRNPIEGAEPSESTAVKFVYTDRSLYVAFRGYDSDPSKVTGVSPEETRGPRQMVSRYSSTRSSIAVPPSSSPSILRARGATFSYTTTDEAETILGIRYTIGLRRSTRWDGRLSYGSRSRNCGFRPVIRCDSVSG